MGSMIPKHARNSNQTAAQLRTVSAWGARQQADLVRLRVGVIGAGSVGGFVGEALTRSGFEDVVLIDFDHIEEKKLDRLLYASSKGEAQCDLICGEGRLEAFRMLGESEIPAMVIDAPEHDCLVINLLENIARRHHRPLDIMQEIGNLHDRGYSDTQIAEKIGCTESWVNMTNTLLSRGEERLVSAVETGLIPVSLAVDIAKAETDEAQNLLMDAYSAGKLKGKRVTAIRRILDQRIKRSKTVRESTLGNSHLLER